MKEKELKKTSVYEVIAEICNKRNDYSVYSKAFRSYERKDTAFVANKNDEQNIAHWFCHSANEWQKLYDTNKTAFKNLVISLKGISGKNNELHRIQRKCIEFCTSVLKVGKANVLSFDNLHTIIRVLEESKKKVEKKKEQVQKVEKEKEQVVEQEAM